MSGVCIGNASDEVFQQRVFSVFRQKEEQKEEVEDTYLHANHRWPEPKKNRLPGHRSLVGTGREELGGLFFVRMWAECYDGRHLYSTVPLIGGEGDGELWKFGGFCFCVRLLMLMLMLYAEFEFANYRCHEYNPESVQWKSKGQCQCEIYIRRWSANSSANFILQIGVFLWGMGILVFELILSALVTWVCL